MSSSRTDQLLEIVMPQLGISVTEGTLLEWRKQPGDHVDADETICEISTDKIDSEIPAPCRGRIVELLVEAGATVDVGTVIARLAPEGAPGGSSGAREVALGAAAAPAVPAPEDPSSPPRGGRHSPVVQRIAAEHGVDLDALVGTGRDGRVRKEDVLAAVERSASRQAAAPAESGLAPGAPYAPPPAGELSPMRRIIGEHMQRSLRTAATVTSWIEVDFERVEARRRALGITALPVVAAATVATLAEFGDLNAWLEGEQYTRHSEVNLGIAVSLGAQGLIVPVVRGAQRLDLVALAGRISELATRARDHTLSPDEVRDGTFTITNPGQFGTLMATPVINQPQVAILDVEAIVKRAVVVQEAGGDAIAIRGVCVLGLSWDHRALDGAYAARFLAALRDRLEATEE